MKPIEEPKKDACKGTDDTLVQWLVMLLPPNDAHVALCGPRALAEALDRCHAGPVAHIAALSDLSAGRWDAVLICDQGADALRETTAATVHAALKEGGRLIVVQPDRGLTAHPWRSWVSQLSATGFTVLGTQPRSRIRDMQRIPAGQIATLVARRDRYRVRAYQDGDEAAILALFGPSFHTSRGVEAWRWKYRRSPYGNLRISMAFDPKNRLVAHYAGYPIPFSLLEDGALRSHIGLQIGDVMTRRDARAVGRGPTSLLARTARHYFASFCEGEVAYNYGFVTGNHRTFSRRFVGAEVLEAVPLRILDNPDVGRAAPRPRLRVERVATCGPAFDRLFRHAAPRYGFLVTRDARYLTWRYLERPDVVYCFLAAYRFGRLVGWSVFRRIGRCLVWGDALFHPGHAAAAAGTLLSAALSALGDDEIDRIEAWFPPRPLWWHHVLLALGFQSRPQSDDLAFLFVPHQMADARERLEGLYYAMGDGDLF